MDKNLKKLETKINESLKKSPVERIPGKPEPETFFQVLSYEIVPGGMSVQGIYKMGSISMDSCFNLESNKKKLAGILDSEWEDWEIYYGGGIEDLEILENKVHEIREKKILDQFQGKEILGFKITKTKKSCTQKGKKYVSQKWQAYCYVGGKQVNIHLGDDPRQAEEKIKAYLAEHEKIREALEKK